MKFLRTVSTQRLLAILAGLIIAVAGGTAIAVAASGGGPVPPRESLAQALHQAATAPTVSGISARITFTNHLIDSTDIQGADPLLNGASGRLWVSTTDHRMRLELQGQNGDAQVVVDNGSYSIYDPTSNTVYKGTLPASADKNSSSAKSEPIPTVAQIQSQLGRLMQHVERDRPAPAQRRRPAGLQGQDLAQARRRPARRRPARLGRRARDPAGHRDLLARQRAPRCSS